MIVMRPNYATNIETPRALRCEIDYLDLSFEAGFALDPDALAARIRPTTRLISLTAPHNPTGVALMTTQQLERVMEIAAGCGAHVLIDEEPYQRHVTHPRHAGGRDA